MGKINEILQNELNSFVELTSDQKSFFKEHGFLKIANVLSPELIHYMDEVITAEVDRLNTQFLEFYTVACRSVLLAAFIRSYSHCLDPLARNNL